MQQNDDHLEAQQSLWTSTCSLLGAFLYYTVENCSEAFVPVGPQLTLFVTLDIDLISVY